MNYLAVFLLLALSSLGGEYVEGKVVMCYVTNWSLYRLREIKFRPEDIDPHLCTHVIHAFFGINETDGTIKSNDKWADFQSAKGGMDLVTKIQRLKKVNPDLKVMISVGGWEEGSIKFSEMADSTRRTATFVKSAFDLLKKHSYDGLDVSWQYPTDRGGIPQDRGNLVNLLKELKKKFKPSGLLLNLRVNGKAYVIDPGYDLKKISEHVDFISLMGHEYNGFWDSEAAPHAPLYSRNDHSVNFSVNYLIEKGAAREKLVLGLGLYGLNYLLENGPVDEPKMGLRIDGGFRSALSKMDGFTPFYEICRNIKKSDWKEYWDDFSKTPFLVNGNMMVSYENEQSVDEKMQYVNKMGLAGASAYSIDQDDFNGACEKGTYPLVKSMKRGLKDGVASILDIRVISHEYEK